MSEAIDRIVTESNATALGRGRRMASTSAVGIEPGSLEERILERNNQSKMSEEDREFMKDPEPGASELSVEHAVYVSQDLIEEVDRQIIVEGSLRRNRYNMATRDGRMRGALVYMESGVSLPYELRDRLQPGEAEVLRHAARSVTRLPGSLQAEYMEAIVNAACASENSKTVYSYSTAVKALSELANVANRVMDRDVPRFEFREHSNMSSLMYSIQTANEMVNMFDGMFFVGGRPGLQPDYALDATATLALVMYDLMAWIADAIRLNMAPHNSGDSAATRDMRRVMGALRDRALRRFDFQGQEPFSRYGVFKPSGVDPVTGISYTDLALAGRKL